MESGGGGGRSVLVAVLLHFHELEAKLELLGSGWVIDQSDNQADTLLLPVSLA
jgi:hypothetical protein